jgi:DNA segregation ATPase FtsK/SpoIIIE-like protein
LLGRGDFLVIARGEKIRVQGAYAAPSELRRVVAQIRARNGRNPGSVGVGQRMVNATSRLIHSLPSLAGNGP